MKNEENIEKIAEEIAKICFDGHYTLFRFTTNWQFGFGTVNPESLLDVDRFMSEQGELYAGRTREEAMYRAIMGFLGEELKTV